MRQLAEDAARVAASRATVVLLGEEGAGKGELARALHELSARAGGPFVRVACMPPEDLLEERLFGQRPGVEPGGTSHARGAIREADRGTLFIDEVGELPPALQPRLLRFLDTGEVLAFGETAPRCVDVRVVVATHRDLARCVEEGRFREDLYYRLQVVPLRVPPLRERREDVLPLARLFVERFAPAGRGAPHLAPDACAALLAHDWPGNVRELRDVIESAVARAELPGELALRHLRIDGCAARGVW